MGQGVLEGEDEEEEEEEGANRSRPLNYISNTKLITFNKIGRRLLLASRQGSGKTRFCLLEASFDIACKR